MPLEAGTKLRVCDMVIKNRSQEDHTQEFNLNRVYQALIPIQK
jgi:hypothetical protein